MKHQTIAVPAPRYEDFDDCLEAAAQELSEHVGEYDRAPRWEGGDEGQRDWILLDVPCGSTLPAFCERR